MKKIGIFGGSFNPPHLGHLYLARQIKKEFGLDEILFLPVGNPPHKSNLASGEDRLALLKLLIGNEDGFAISDSEIMRNKTTYTVDTLEELDANRTGDAYLYLIGSDTVFVIETWRNFRRVAELTDFICLMRPGDDAGAVKEKIADIESRYPTHFLLSSAFGLDVSSSEIRKRIREGDMPLSMLSEDMIGYIKKRGLYAD